MESKKEELPLNIMVCAVTQTMVKTQISKKNYNIGERERVEMSS